MFVSFQEREKVMKEEKAAEMRKMWLKEKSVQEKLRKKMDKLKLDNERCMKEAEELKVRKKADENFHEWMDKKRQEEKAKKQEERRRKEKEDELRQKRQSEAEEKYQQWLKHHKAVRPKSAPGERTGKSIRFTAFSHLGVVISVVIFVNFM